MAAKRTEGAAARAIGLTLAALSLAGCIVGPSYRTPDRVSTAPAAFAETSDKTASVAPPGRWWKLYDDPALDRLVSAALAHNTDLRQAEASLVGARAALEQARAARLPTTDISIGAPYGRATGVVGSPAPSAGLTYEPAFDASYDLDLFGRLRRAIQAARADVEALAAAEDLVRVDVAAETARAYAAACTYGEQADVQRRSVQVVTESFQGVLRQRELGAVSDFELANARTLLEQTRAAIPALEASRRYSLYGLAVLTGAQPEAVDPAAAACRRAPRLIQPIPIGDGAALIRRRPDVREAERRLASASAQIGVATADLYPTVTLGGSIASLGRSAAELASRRDVSYSVGPLITWGFPNLVAAHARIRAAEAATQVAYAAFDGTVLAALQNVEQSLATYAGELDRNAALRAARDQATEAYQLGLVRLQAGSISFIDLLTIERTQVLADQDLAASDAALVNDQVSAFKALGGGWSDAEAVPLPSLPAKGAKS